MAGMRSRWRMRCRAGLRKAAKFKHNDFTIRHSPKHYKRPVKCPICGSEDVLDYEAIYRRKQAKRERCSCSGPPHPHRPGSHRLCETHPLAAVPLTEEEEHHYISVIHDGRRTREY